MREPKYNNLFFALWPDQEVRSELARIQQDVSSENGRLHHLADLHMTLAFLGRVKPEELGCIQRAADTVVAESFTLKLDRIGYWKGPRIVWCGPSVCPEPLNQLVHDLQNGLSECGFNPEERTYKPHVTLARKAKKIMQAPLDQQVLWIPKRFVLAGSVSSPKVPRYCVIKRWDIIG